MSYNVLRYVKQVIGVTVKFIRKPLQKEGVRGVGNIQFINQDTQEYNFPEIEEKVKQGLIHFGSLNSKLTPLQQFHLWRKMIQEGSFESRDAFCKLVDSR